jgi:hypothetical protein
VIYFSEFVALIAEYALPSEGYPDAKMTRRSFILVLSRVAADIQIHGSTASLALLSRLREALAE